jgi:hypothetical protein
MTSLTRILYTSAAGSSLDGESLKRLIKSARGTNAALCVTSMLVRCGSDFLQVLEGNPDTVEELFSRITRDQRHSGISVLVKEHADQHLFGHWPLGFSVLTAAQVAMLSGAQNSGIEELSLTELNVGRAKHLLSALTRAGDQRAASGQMQACAAA